MTLALTDRRLSNLRLVRREFEDTVPWLDRPTLAASNVAAVEVKTPGYSTCTLTLQNFVRLQAQGNVEICGNMRFDCCTSSNLGIFLSWLASACHAAMPKKSTVKHNSLALAHFIFV